MKSLTAEVLPKGKVEPLGKQLLLVGVGVLCRLLHLLNQVVSIGTTFDVVFVHAKFGYQKGLAFLGLACFKEVLLTLFFQLGFGHDLGEEAQVTEIFVALLL